MAESLQFSAKAGERLGIAGVITHRTPSGAALSALLNRVTVGVLEQEQYQAGMAVIQPVAEIVARQLHASQVLSFSRARSTKNVKERQEVEQARERLRDYLNLLEDIRCKQLSQEMHDDLDSLQMGLPQAKQTVYNAYQKSHSMRGKK